MEQKYKTCQKIQGISVISYTISMIFLWLMIYGEMPFTSIIIIAVISTLSLIATTTSGIIRAFIGHKMGLKSTKKDWLIIGFAILLVTIYFSIKLVKI